MKGVLAGIWYFAPGSKSVAGLPTGGATPWYMHLSHQILKSVFFIDDS